MKRGIAGVVLVLFFMVLFGMTNTNAAEYIGVKKCKACHMKQYKSWKETTMADSFENLKPGVNAEAKKKAAASPKPTGKKDK